MTIHIGKQLLDIVTAGMYSDPLMVLREYVQNSADSIDNAISEGLINKGDGQIHITINGRDRSITIEDNGSGQNAKDIEDVLCSIGHSSKNSQFQRGFRGIGRLGGLGYCDELRFETRKSQSEQVSTVTWVKTGKQEKKSISRKEISLKDTIDAITEVAKREPNENDPPRFFRVRLKNIRKFHSDDLMNINKVRGYLSQVAPVAYDHDLFQFAGDIEEFLTPVTGYCHYRLQLNDKAILRPYKSEIRLSKGRSDQISDIVKFELSNENNELLGRGWYALFNFYAALPASEKERGIRVRQGNIEVGNEFFLEHHFTESRFSTWHIGEIHLSPLLKTNARRDGFEQSKEYEKFMEDTKLLGKHLSNLCRKASKKRCAINRLDSELNKVEILISGAQFIDEKNQIERAEEIRNLLNNASATIKDNELNSQYIERYQEVERKMKYLEKGNGLHQILDGRVLRHIEKKELIESICSSIASNYHENNNPDELIKAILEPYMTSSAFKN